MPDARTHAAASALFLRLAALAENAREAGLRAEPDAEVREATRALLRGHGAKSGVLDAPLGLNRSRRVPYRAGTQGLPRPHPAS